MQARKLMRKGCEAYLAVVLDSKRAQVKLEDIPVVNDFSDVFPEELPGLPLEREVALSIDVMSGTSPISQTPYRVALTEVKELKVEYNSDSTRKLG